MTPGTLPVRFFWLLAILPLALLAGCGNRFQPQNTPTTPGSPVASPVPSPTNTTPNPTPVGSPSPTAANKPETIRNLETRLRTVVAETIQVAVESVDCPATTQEIKAGVRVDCKLAADGQSFPVTVEWTDATGQFRWNTKGLLQLAKLEQFLQQELKTKNAIEVSADCTGEIRVAQPGETFECKVTDAQSKSRSVQVTVKDEQGNVDIKLL
jgi:hypothetical protein